MVYTLHISLYNCEGALSMRSQAAPIPLLLTPNSIRSIKTIPLTSRARVGPLDDDGAEIDDEDDDDDSLYGEDDAPLEDDYGSGDIDEDDYIDDDDEDELESIVEAGDEAEDNLH